MPSLRTLSQFRNALAFLRKGSEPASGPAKVSWEIINSCDSKCRSCQRWTEETSPRMLSTEEGKRLLDDIAAAGSLSVSFTGGEPTLREDVFDLVAHARARGLSTALSSNGLTLGDDRARRLVGSGLNVLSISIDGPDPETNDDIRGVDGYFEKAVAAIAGVRALRGGRRWPRVHVNATISDSNVGVFHEMADVAIRAGADALTVQPVHNFAGIGLGVPPSMRLLAENEGRVRDAIDKIRNRHPRLMPHPKGFLDGVVEYVANPKALYRYRCAAAFLFAQIDPDGFVYPCPIKFAAIGNVREKSFGEIWRSHEAAQVRRRIEAADHPMCWMNCIAPMTLLADDIRRFRFGDLLRPRALRHVFSKAFVGGASAG